MGIMKNKAYRVTEDNFIWILINRVQAELLYKNEVMEVYCLFLDDSESLIEELSDLNKSDVYGIEVGYIDKKN
ncbi:MAG: hypothetical protein PEPC_01806 [Peptostreptococcus russellii]